MTYTTLNVRHVLVNVSNREVLLKIVLLVLFVSQADSFLGDSARWQNVLPDCCDIPEDLVPTDQADERGNQMDTEIPRLAFYV